MDFRRSRRAAVFPSMEGCEFARCRSVVVTLRGAAILGPYTRESLTTDPVVFAADFRLATVQVDDAENLCPKTLHTEHCRQKRRGLCSKNFA